MTKDHKPLSDDLITEIKKLPNLIVGPTLDEVFRNLEPIQAALNKINSDNEHRALTSDTDSQALHGKLKDINSLLATFTNQIASLPNQIATPILEEIFRTLLPLRQEVGAARNEINTVQQVATVFETNLKDEIRKLSDNLDKVALKMDQSKFDHTDAFLGLDTAALSRNIAPVKAQRPNPISNYKPDAFFDQLEEFRPELYVTWKKLFNNAKKSYLKAPNHNCSTWSSSRARAFRNYIRIFCKGQILDIGCGPHADPMYLQGLDAERLSAIEPLKLVAEPRFPIYPAVNEFIPFKDKSFQTVVNATALDHVIDVERALEETERVLDVGGYFIIWYANVTTAPNPLTDYDGPLDDYHLFHTNDEWFIPLLDKYFDTVDRRVFPANETIDDVFAVYQKK